jgi:hypothetical protein
MPCLASADEMPFAWYSSIFGTKWYKALQGDALPNLVRITFSSLYKVRAGNSGVGDYPNGDHIGWYCPANGVLVENPDGIPSLVTAVFCDGEAALCPMVCNRKEESRVGPGIALSFKQAIPGGKGLVSISIDGVRNKVVQAIWIVGYNAQNPVLGSSFIRPFVSNPFKDKISLAPFDFKDSNSKRLKFAKYDLGLRSDKWVPNISRDLSRIDIISDRFDDVVITEIIIVYD